MKQQPSLQRRPSKHRLALALATCLAFVPAAYAQTTSATLRGQVGADAEVTATNAATGLVRKVKAGADGNYTLGGLPPGTYKIDSSNGAHQDVTLQVGQTATLNLANATPAPTTPATLEQVEVHATTLAEVRTSEIANYISQKQIEALPQGSRNFLAFADIVPGMQFSQSSDGSSKLKSGAQSSNGINVYIDGVGQKNYVLKGGVSNQDSSRGNPFPQLAIGEYKVITSNYKAEYDQISSAAITAVTKSGTNEFHGDIFFDYTDQDWRNETPNEEKTKNKVDSMEKQYGFAIGGPIIKDVLQFFFTYEAKDYAEPAEVRVGENLPLSALPANLQPLVGTYSVPFNEDLYFGKLTWNVNEENLVELTAKYRSEDQLSNIGNGPNTASFGSTKQQEDKRGDLRWQYSGEHWLNDAHITFEDSFYSPHALTDGLGYRLVTPNRGAILNLGAGEENQYKGQKGISLQDDLSYTDFEWNGDHTFKMGFKVKSVKLQALEQAPNSPQYFYDILESLNDPFRVEFGQTVPGATAGPIESTNKQYGVYFQDDWAVNEHLTLNLGVRYDYEKTPSYLNYVTRPELVTALHNWANIQHTDYNIDDYISNGHNRKAFKDAWQPRLGFSYDLGGDEQHVIFGGIGRAYDRNLFDYLQVEQTKGVFPRYGFDFNTAAHPCDPAASTSCLNWDPKYLNPVELAKLVAANPNLGGEVNMINNKLKTPYSDQLSLGMRNQLGDWNTSVTLQHVESKDGIIFSLGNRWPDGSFRDPSKPGATWGNQPWGFPIPGFGTLIKADNGVETRLNALLLSLDKPFTKESRWGATVAYTFNDAKENRVNAADADEHYVFDYPNLSQHGWHRSTGIARHRVVLTGIVDPGWDTTVSGKLTLSSPVTKDATNCFMVDGDHCSFDPFTPNDTVGFKQFDISAAKTVNLDNVVQLHIRADLLNVFDWHNWTDYDTWRGFGNDANPTFGTVNGTGIVLPTRTLKLSVGASF